MTDTILIVDDQREVIRVLTASLESLGKPFRIIGVPSGEEGLMEARLNAIDLLITDLRLPGMSGLELLDQIRLQRPQIRTILITGVSDPQLRNTAARAGADAFFLKPVAPADFLAAVEQLLGLVASAPVAKPQAVSASPDLRISERLSRLRRELRANSVTLVNEDGQVLVRAGSLPDPETEGNVLPSLMSAYSAGRKVSHFLGDNRAENIYFYHGERFDLVMSPFGAYALVVATQQDVDGPLAGNFHTAVHAARREIADLLEEMGIWTPETLSPPASPAFSETQAERPLDPGELDDHLEDLLTGGAPTADADTFWDPEKDAAGDGSINADALSYEQALQLGIAPEDHDVAG